MNNPTVIKVEDVSKQYRLGLVSSKTLAHDFNRFLARIKGKEDPYLKIGESNDQTKRGNSEYIWALQDINFEVKQGEVLGIIGRNGAGKSTLLKVLSRITAPTTGTIKLKGRVASLLEVGTGFHPELTGRENVYQNGAILGMTKVEITSKMDVIIDFAGVQRFIDTPVKRYSSGMYVRLAFAIAAHLEPEILIVDEVLAVGDADFQKKCIGKMKEVSGKGRTVLFVSHNMASVKNLCTRSMLLDNGKVTFQGSTEDAIEKYLGMVPVSDEEGTISEKAATISTGEAKFTHVKIVDPSGKPTPEIKFRDPIKIHLDYTCAKDIDDALVSVQIISKESIMIVDHVNLYDTGKGFDLKKGGGELSIQLQNNLQPGIYYISLTIGHSNGNNIFTVEHITNFEVLKLAEGEGEDYPFNWVNGYIHGKAEWELQ